MSSWINPSSVRYKTKETVNGGDEGDEESEDQVVYQYDVASELLGLTQQPFQGRVVESTGAVRTARRRPVDIVTSTSFIPSAVEEAAWASLTQADKHGKVSQQQNRNDIYPEDLNANELQVANSDLDTHGVMNNIGGQDERGFSEALQEIIVSEKPDVNVHRQEQTFMRAEASSVSARVAGQATGSVEPERRLRFNHAAYLKGKQKHHQGDRFRIISTKGPQSHVYHGGSVPLVQRLQELTEVDSSHGNESRQSGRATNSFRGEDSNLSITEKFQCLVETSASPSGSRQSAFVTKQRKKSTARLRRVLPVATASRSGKQDDIVDALDSDEDDSGGSANYSQDLRTVRSRKNLSIFPSLVGGEQVEDIDSDDNINNEEITRQKPLLMPLGTGSTISERFHSALLSAPPDPPSFDEVSLSARVETVLMAQKSKHLLFTKSLLRQPQLGNLHDCLEVNVMETTEEAQLTTCNCEVLRFPTAWRDCEQPSEKPWKRVDVIFSKISSGVDLQVGRVIRIHPPWQEVPRSGQSARLIVCTIYCEILR